MAKRITEFYNLLLQNQDNMTVLEEKLSKISSEEGFKELVAREVIPVAKVKGFDFTEEDLLNYEKEMLEKLSEEELMNVSGGVSLMNKKALSLFLASVSLAGNIQSTQAVVRRDVIMKSIGKIVGEESAGQNQQEGTGEEARQQEEKPKMSGEQVMRAQSQQFELMEEEEHKEEEERKEEEEYKEAEEHKKEEEHKEEVDVPYILDALNLVDPYIFNLTGTTENFRFFDGYKQKIFTQERITAADGIPSWDYNKDEGAGSPNFMRCLFPSSAGVLNVAGGASDLEKFSQDCKPTPELVAQVIGYIHNHIRNENEAAARDLNGLMEKFDQGNAEQFLEDYLNIPIVKGNRKSKTYLQTVLYLLKNAEIMVKEQESDGQDPEKILPKYMPERMFMSYFILNFNEEKEVDAFYTEAKRVIKTESNVDQSEIDRSRERLGKVTELLGKIKQREGSPYRERTQQNNFARLIERDDNGKAKFSNKKFPDCADIAVRHIINLLSYNEKDSWKFIVDVDVKDKNLEKELEDILDGMRNEKEFKFKSLEERVKLFFYYQANNPQGADAVDPETRSLWNYVISNMDKNNKEDEMYELQYNRRENELKPGYLNMLKAIYNIVYALKRRDAEVNTKFKGVRESIKDLEETIKANRTGDDLKKALCTAIEDTFSLISVIEKTEVDGDDVNIYGTDCFCTAKVNDFVISQKEGHAFVDFNPLSAENIKNDDPLKEFLMEDSTAQLLSRAFKCASISKLSVFNILFLSCGDWSHYDTMFFKNFKALKFLKNAQGEGGNTFRICHLIGKYCEKESNIKIFDESGVKAMPLPMFVFTNYVTTDQQFEKLIPNGTLNEVFKDYQGEIFEKGGVRFCFKEIADEKVTIYPLVDGNIKDLKIPSSISVKGKDYKVSRIGTCSFLNNKTLETVTIEDGIEDLTIEDSVFKGSSIKKLTVPESVKNLDIQAKAFVNSNIQEIKMSDGNMKKLSIGEYAFETRSLRKFNLPNGIKEVDIRAYAFSESNLKKFIVPESVEKLSVGVYAFFGSGLLEEFNILANIRELGIGMKAFIMSSIKKFVVHGNIESLNIGEEVFALTNQLEEFRIYGNVNELVLQDLAFFKSSIKNFEVSGSVQKLIIGSGAFAYTESLEEFNVPSSVKNLDFGGMVFEESGVKEIIIPAGVENLAIGGCLFDGTRSSIDFNIPATVKELHLNRSEFTDSAIEEFQVPNGVKKLIIGRGAFAGGRSKEFIVPAIVEELEIGEEAFKGSNIEKFEVLGNLNKVKIWDSAFSGTSSLREFILPASDKVEVEVKGNPFEASSIDRSNIPAVIREKIE